MSSETKYREHLRRLGLTEKEGKELISALECIVESLLNKKYMLENADEKHSVH